MQQYQTENGRREDLEALPTNPVLGFIGNEIYPVVNTREKTGTIYYRTLTADGAAQTGRAAGAAPTRTLLTDSDTTFTTAEVIKRYGVVRDEVKQMGGIAQADALGGTASKRSVQRAIEEAIADAVLLNGSATVADILDSFIERAQIGLEAIRRYPGEKALVCSHTIFNRIMRYTEITDRFNLSSLAISGASAEAVVGRRPEALRMVLAGILGVDRVLVGDDDQWYDSDVAKQDRAALCVLPDAAEFSHKMDPVLGKNMLYLPDGQQPFVVESHYDPDVYVNNYDASAWYQLQTLNAGALYILDGIDEDNAVTTTTTTV
jgi:hypothetical protein